MTSLRPCLDAVAVRICNSDAPCDVCRATVRDLVVAFFDELDDDDLSLRAFELRLRVLVAGSDA